ncbi:MAG TPA: VOC family protein [Afifellaceae bacterium]|nr:VOC family protein [Afifellaceae bacterium]
MDKIDYIEFPTSDGAASGKFFSDAFGWKLIDYGPTYTGLDGAGIDGGIDAGAGRVAAPLAVIRAENLDDAERRVVAAGGIITRAQFDFPGGRRFHFREPGGSELAVYAEKG